MDSEPAPRLPPPATEAHPEIMQPLFHVQQKSGSQGAENVLLQSLKYYSKYLAPVLLHCGTWSPG